MFNIDNGYLEGLCRGFKNGILKQADYLNLVQCETLEGKAETRSKLAHNNAGLQVMSREYARIYGVFEEIPSGLKISSNADN